MSDLATVKRAASGRWHEILTALAGLPGEVLDGRHHPCPKCGGTDRFRAIDVDNGVLFCNACFSSKNGDGIAALRWLTGWDFPTAVQRLGEYLGVSSKRRGHTGGRKEKLAENLSSLEQVVAAGPAMMDCYAAAKPPITRDGIEKCGGVAVRWHGLPCLRFDSRAPIDASEPTGAVLVRSDGSEFPKTKTLGPRKTHTLGGSANSWTFTGNAGQVKAAHTIIEVEGIGDWLAVASTNLPTGVVAVTETAGARARGKLPRPWAEGKRILVAGDADEPGQEGQRRSAAAYVKAGAAEVLLVTLPYQISKDHGKDVRDALNDGNAIEQLPTVPVTAEQAAEWSAGTKRRVGGTDREIIIGPDESRVVNEAIEALATQENVYERGGLLVQVIESAEPPRGIARPKESPRIAGMRFARIREHLAAAANWQKQASEDEREQVHPPDWVVKAVDARGQWQGVHRLEAVVESPVLRADGTVVQEPGYDRQTGILFRPQVAFPRIPDSPSRDDALRAAAGLLEVVEDFPFAGSEHRSAWLASVLTPLARYTYSGAAPLFLFDANCRGVGKSLLTDATSMIISGRPMARMSWPRDDDETRKRITSIAIAGESLVLIDNIPPSGLGSPSLDAALTATSWSDRILGSTAMASNIPLYATWFATGNNVTLLADTARRVLHVRLESPEENPESRSDFHHADLLAWVRQQRQRLTAAAVTILAAYCAAGRPEAPLPTWGSFEAWSAIIRQALVWVGLPDPADTRTELVGQSDREATALRQLIEGWAEIDPAGAGVTVASVVRELSENPDCYETLRSALHELCPPKDGKTLNPRSIGMKLHHVRRRVVGGRFLDRRDARQGAIWAVYGPGDCGTIASSGTIPGPYARAGAHAQAHAHAPATGNSSASPSSPAPDPAKCSHDYVVVDGGTGLPRRVCCLCGDFYGCIQSEAIA